MYALTLTREERKAIDWIGDRYRHGYELWVILRDTVNDREGDWDEWDGNMNMVFWIPEHSAWKIREIVDEGSDCFGPWLVDKLRAFANRIV